MFNKVESQQNFLCRCLQCKSLLNQGRAALQRKQRRKTASSLNTVAEHIIIDFTSIYLSIYLSNLSVCMSVNQSARSSVYLSAKFILYLENFSISYETQSCIYIYKCIWQINLKQASSVTVIWRCGGSYRDGVHVCVFSWYFAIRTPPTSSSVDHSLVDPHFIYRGKLVFTPS